MIWDNELWRAVFGRPALLFDLVLLGLLSALHIATWMSLDPTPLRSSPSAGEGIRSAASGGITVVGILVPVTLLALQLGADRNGPGFMTRSAVIDLFVATAWLLLSLVAGLYVLFVAAYKGFASNVFARRDVGILFGLQLLFLLTGVARITWGVASIATRLLQMQ